jgi:hypothetical protein
VWFIRIYVDTDTNRFGSADSLWDSHT